MKRISFTLAVLVLTVLSFWTGLLLWGFSWLAKGLSTGEPQLFEKGYTILQLSPYKPPFFQDLPKLFSNKNYLVLLQNNAEIRPSGGFMGSYAKLKFNSGVLQEWEVEDIYVPDGQIEGHVNPPKPILTAFKHGFWRLRDANWDVDFAHAARDIKWFFGKGGEENVDGIIAINFNLFQKWLEIVGPLRLTDFSEVVTADNSYELIQKYVEEDFFPGSIRKRAFLSAVSSALVDSIKNAGPLKQIKILESIIAELERGQILIWVDDLEIGKRIKEMGFDGGLGDYINDYLYVVESNLGANKANVFVEREIVQNIDAKEGIANENLSINFENRGEGSLYVNYLRMVVPFQSQIVSVKVGDRFLKAEVDNAAGVVPEEDESYSWEDRGKFRILGFWVIVKPKSKEKAEVSYRLVNQPQGGKRFLTVKRQPGIEKLPYKLIVNGKVVADTAIYEKEMTFSF